MANASESSERRADGEEDPEDAYPSESEETAHDAAQWPLHEAQVDADHHARKFLDNRAYYELMEPRVIVDIAVHGSDDHGVFDFAGYADLSGPDAGIDLLPTGEGDEQRDRRYRLLFENAEAHHRDTRLQLGELDGDSWGTVGHGVTRLEVQP